MIKQNLSVTLLALCMSATIWGQADENGKIVENITFGSSLEYTEIEIEKAGTYKFDIKYLTGDTNRPMSITVNNYDPVIVQFPQTTASWGNPADANTATTYLHFDTGSLVFTVPVCGISNNTNVKTRE